MCRIINLFPVLYLVCYIYMPVNCKVSAEADIRPDPTNCTRFYIYNGGTPYLFNCTDTQVFNPCLKVCDRWVDLTSCENSDYTVCEYDDEIYEKPHFCDCTKFITCDFGQPVINSCPPGSYFMALQGRSRIPIQHFRDRNTLANIVCRQGSCAN